MFGYLPEFKSYYLRLLTLTNFDSNFSDDNINFSYQAAKNQELLRLREKYCLDKITGDGDEISQIINLMHWVDSKLNHGNVIPPEPCNSLHILEVVERESTKVNCYAIAIVLNEVFLSMGFRSRRIHCRPYDAFDMDSHVVTEVYSASLKKWVFMDASWNTYITNECGELLSLNEFRYYLANDIKLRINGGTEDENWREFYTGYMAKNLFWFMTPMESKYNNESADNTEYGVLLPKYYEPFELSNKLSYPHRYHIFRNPEIFWN